MGPTFRSVGAPSFSLGKGGGQARSIGLLSCLPPTADGEVNIDDILAGIAAFQSNNNDPLTWFDIAPAFGDGVPNQMVDIDDILANIQGFQSKAYPGLGPLDCP